jgi:hypothetical protein
VKKKSDGYALVLTMVLLVVLSLLGTAILSIAYGETKMVANQVENKRAYYAARSGADAMASYIIEQSSNNTTISGVVDDLIFKIETLPGTGTIGTGATISSFQVNVSRIPSGPYRGDLLLESTGTTATGTLPVKVSLTLKQALRTVLDTTIFANDSMSLGNNITVNGDIGTNAGSITFGRNPVNGNVILGPDATQTYLNNSVDPMCGTPQRLNEKIIFPNTKTDLFPTENNNSQLGTPRHGHNPPTPYVVTATPSDPGNHVLATAVTDLSDIMANITWPAGGGGELHILISDTITNFTLGSQVNVPDGNTLYLYYNGTNQIADNSGNFSYQHLSIYAPNASFNITGGGNGTFLGKMVIGTYDDTSNSHVTLTNDTTVDQNDIIGAETYQRDAWLK